MKTRPRQKTLAEIIRSAYVVRIDTDGVEWGPAFLWHRWPYASLASRFQLVIRAPGGALLAMIGRSPDKPVWEVDAVVLGRNENVGTFNDLMRAIVAAEDHLLRLAWEAPKE